MAIRQDELGVTVMAGPHSSVQAYRDLYSKIDIVTLKNSCRHQGYFK